MRRWIAAMALLALYPAVARGADMLNLPDAVSMAIDHAPSYAAAAAGRDAAQEQRTIGRAWLLPYVHATGGYAYYRQKYGYSNPNAFLQDSQANFNRTQGELTVSQPLFDLSRLADYRQGKLAAQAGDIRFDVSLQQLLLGVSQAYVRVVVARSADQAARAQEQAMDKLAEQATAAFKAGTKNINDSLEAESRLDLARAARIQADNDVAQAEAALTSLIGPHTPNMAVFSTSAATPLPQPDDVAHWQSLAAKDSPYVRLGAIGTAAPSLSLVGPVGYDKATGSAFHTGTTTRTERIGVELSVPLYAGGGTWAQLRLDEKLASKAELDLEEAKRQARLDAQAAFLAVHAAQAQVTALSQAERSARKARQAAVLGYQVGLRDIVERLDAEERLYSAVHELTQARGDYLMARLRLASSVGRLDQAMIRKTAANLLTAPMTDAGDQSGMRMAP